MIVNKEESYTATGIFLRSVIIEMVVGWKEEAATVTVRRQHLLEFISYLILTEKRTHWWW